jgi:CO dehydrogenase nickel-insertion accessory protein CooC1
MSTGVGGSGKTVFAKAIAHKLLANFKEGVLFVDLSAIADPESVLSAIAQSSLPFLTEMAVNTAGSLGRIKEGIFQVKRRTFSLQVRYLCCPSKTIQPGVSKNDGC